MKQISHFRGAYSPQHEWVYGDYYNNCECGSNQDIIINSDHLSSVVVENIVNHPYINQSISLKDKEGKDIYVDDIMEQITTTGERKLYKVFLVDGGFAINEHQDKFYIKPESISFYASTADMQTASFIRGNLKIIGSIYKNPELLIYKR